MSSFARPFAKVLRTFSAALGRHGGGFTLVPITINGTFADATGWALGASCTIDTGSMRLANAAANVNCDYAISLPAGIYRVQYDVVAQNQGNITPQFVTTVTTVSGTTNFNPITLGTYVQDIAVPDPITTFRIRGTRSNNLMDVRVDNVILQRLSQG